MDSQHFGAAAWSLSCNRIVPPPSSLRMMARYTESGVQVAVQSRPQQVHSTGRRSSRCASTSAAAFATPYGGRHHRGRAPVTAVMAAVARLMSAPVELGLCLSSSRCSYPCTTIGVGSRDAYAEIVVGNDGLPIPAEERERIFDRFVRLDDSRSRADGGTGLGLSIARDIVGAHGGTLTVDDLDKGAAMRIRLPLPIAFNDS